MWENCLAAPPPPPKTSEIDIEIPFSLCSFFAPLVILFLLFAEIASVETDHDLRFLPIFVAFKMYVFGLLLFQILNMHTAFARNGKFLPFSAFKRFIWCIALIQMTQRQGNEHFGLISNPSHQLPVFISIHSNYYISVFSANQLKPISLVCHFFFAPAQSIVPEKSCSNNQNWK